MEMVVILFFLKTLGKGLMIGGIGRLIISMIFKIDMTLGGFIRSAIIIGVMYTAFIVFVVSGIGG